MVLPCLIRAAKRVGSSRRVPDDVIRQINGIPLDSPQKALEVYQQLESGQSISLNILRGRSEQTLSYELK